MNAPNPAPAPTETAEELKQEVEQSKKLYSALDVTEYATGPAGEAWALMARLFFQHGKPRFPMIAAEFGLHASQAICLRLLDQPRPMGELATAMHCDNSNITGIVDRLEERGLVERQPADYDRRVKLIAPTAEGVQTREKLNRALAEPPEALTALPEKDVLVLRDLLRNAVAE